MERTTQKRTRQKHILTLLLFALLLAFGTQPAFAAEGITPETNAVAISTIWVLLAAFLVFLMHAGFTMVETGFTQAKNSVNIIMKNFMTVSIGILMYYFVGYAFMFGNDASGIIGTSGFLLGGVGPEAAGLPTYAFFFFQAVFAATCATIVSGAMAERTKFITYLVFTILICGFTYPMIGHWIWSADGWLAKLGFIDFAGSTVVHAVGGFSALIGAFLVGPRLGKYAKDGTANIIPAHSIPLGALGVLLLWFGWFGFNCGSTLDGTTDAIARIAVTTVLAGAAAAVSSMIISWVKYGKPDVSLTLNGNLAGLVAITAGCAVVSPLGAIVIGLLAGGIMIFAVEFFDKRVRIDDPVGAISVHGVSGTLGTILVGVFATDGGLLYGGGFRMIGIQALGVFSAGLMAMAMAGIVFVSLRAILGLRISDQEQVEGLDIGEHGMTAYAPELERLDSYLEG